MSKDHVAYLVNSDLFIFASDEMLQVDFVEYCLNGSHDCLNFIAFVKVMKLTAIDGTTSKLFLKDTNISP